MNEVTVNQLAALTDRIVVDVRESFEFVTGRVPGAINIPLGELALRHGEIPTGRPIHIICASGGRSTQATQHLAAFGHDAINVAGGTAAWRSAHYPIER